MNIGFIGLGKLGLPCALAVESRGHKVVGYDPSEQVKKVVIIISTVLPGTIRREIKPIIEDNPYFKLCYNPFFIAMGTTMRDFLSPEIVLFGDDEYKELNRGTEVNRLCISNQIGDKKYV